MTIDPRISSLFDDTVWFHRPISSVLTFFEDEACAKLLQSGPHSANAALESLLHCGFKKILCIGCDFSAQKRSYPRSKNALGDSPRDLDIPVLGRNGKTVFSSATLLDASYYFANAASVYQAKIYSVKSGVELSGIDMTLVDLDDSLANEFFNTDELYNLLGVEISTCLDQKELCSRILQYSIALDQYLANLKDIISSFSLNSLWCLDIARQLDTQLCLDESNLAATDAFCKRLCRLPLTLMMIPLHDASTSGEWTIATSICIENLDLLQNFYSNFFNVLFTYIQQPNSDFSWNQFKELTYSI
tara:strand:- start:487 stop:1395 length:909 start_codon:yes stop_codon:yes gene_type:complete